MAASVLVCRHQEADIIGCSYDPSSSHLAVTVKGDGVSCYDVGQQRRVASIPLGSGITELQCRAASMGSFAGNKAGSPAAGGLLAVVVHDVAGGALVCVNPSSPDFKTLADASPRVHLPAPARFCHILRPSTKAGSGGPDSRHVVAVVLTDGRVASILEGSDPLQLQMAAPVQAPHPSPRTILSASHGDTLVLATQPHAGESVTIRIHRVQPNSSGGIALAAARETTVAAPSKHSTACGLTMSSAFALLQWSTGSATVVHGLSSTTAPSPAPLKATTLALLVEDPAGTASTSAPAGGPATPAAGRKRKTPAPASDGAANGPSTKLLCAAVDASQFIVLDLESASVRSQVCYTLRDAQFGCPLGNGTVDVDAPLLSLTPAQCAVVHSDPDVLLLRLGGAVHSLHMRSQPVSLLSLVARLSLSSTAASAAVRPAGGAAGPPALPPLAQLPAPVSISPALLAQQQPAATAAASGAELAAAVADTLLQPVPATSLTRLDDTANQLVAQLAAARAAQQAPPKAVLDSAASYISGCREHGVALLPQLLSLTAQGLAAAGAWQQLASLLAALEPGSLAGCSDVLPAAAAAQQYALLPRMATVLDDVEPADMVAALQHLLAPTTPVNAAARRQHRARLRAAAEALVSSAEATLSAGLVAASTTPAPRRSGRNSQQQQQAAAAAADPAPTLAIAQCAAAAVDDFTPRECLLHPLLAMPADGVALQGALRQLGGAQVEALLAYLAKWVAKYAGGALGDAASSVVLPQELLFPYFSQVLEWTRVTIDAHLTRLLMSPTSLPAVESLEASLGGALGAARKLMMLRGAAEHIHAHAPLPAAHIAVATQYTVEALDLRVH